jgi:S-adenosylmethionine:tRNA ribosyltransferase-isomerase
VRIEKVLLHVGLGTFANVETEDIENHHMHKEYIELEDNVATKLNNYKQNGKRIIAIGTTSIRVLESFSDEN